VFFALFETLNWCVSLDDYAREWWAPDGVALGWAWRERAGGVELVGLLNAVRYARNLVHHQWADALALEDGVRIPYTEPN
jgi:hypothetical protein